MHPRGTVVPSGSVSAATAYLPSFGTDGCRRSASETTARV